MCSCFHKLACLCIMRLFLWTALSAPKPFFPQTPRILRRSKRHAPRCFCPMRPRMLLLPDVTTVFTLTAFAAVCGVGLVAAYLIVKQLFPRFASARVGAASCTLPKLSCLPLCSVTSPNSVFSKSLEAVQKDEKVKACSSTVHLFAHACTHPSGEECVRHPHQRFRERLRGPSRRAPVRSRVGWLCCVTFE